jgi:thioredoxin-like negative regulator of GroEL
VQALKGAVRLAKVNIDAMPQLAEQFGVKQLPTVLALHDRYVITEY